MTDATQPPGTQSGESNQRNNPTNNVVQRTRAWTGLWVIIAADVAIALAAIWGTVKISDISTSAATPIVAILTSSFTAISATTATFFGIKSAQDTAQSYSPQGGTAPPADTASEGGARS